MDKMLDMIMPKGVPNLPLSSMNVGGMGPVLLKPEERDDQREPPPKPAKAGQAAKAQAQGIRPVACTMSMEAMGIQSSKSIDGVEYGGVAEYLGAAQKSGTNLFI
jgi:peroxiredoxin family protein